MILTTNIHIIGGVYGLYFDEDGNVIDYKTLLNDTSRNCGGGLRQVTYVLWSFQALSLSKTDSHLMLHLHCSPWNTWISCEEVSKGQCWQIDPNPLSEYHETPMETLLGGADGGKFETVVSKH